jgi:hypothetical protein
MSIPELVATNAVTYLVGFWLSNLWTRAIPVHPKINVMVITACVTVAVCQFA